MQTRSRRYMVVASVALGLTLAACSSSTAPAPISSTQLANDFDAIFSADQAAHTDADSQAADLVAEFFELGPAYGGGEASFTATTSSGTQTWHGVGFAVTAEGDTAYLAAMYPNRDLQQAVFMYVQESNGTGQDSLAAASVSGLETGADDSIMTLVPTLESVGSSACTQQSGLAAASVFDELFNGQDVTCAPAKFQMAFNAIFPAAADLGALETVSGTVTISGPLFTEPGGPSHVVGIPSKMAALIARLQTTTRFHPAR
jgi:hypothetical protein